MTSKPTQVEQATFLTSHKQAQYLEILAMLSWRVHAERCQSPSYCHPCSCISETNCFWAHMATRLHAYHHLNLALHGTGRNIGVSLHLH